MNYIVWISFANLVLTSLALWNLHQAKMLTEYLDELCTEMSSRLIGALESTLELKDKIDHDKQP